MHPPGRAVDLPRRTPTPPAPRRLPLGAMLPDQAGLRLLPRQRCAPHACEGLGWCEQRQVASATPTCACLFQLGEQPGVGGMNHFANGRRGGGRHRYRWRAGEGGAGDEPSRCNLRAHQAGHRHRQPPWQRGWMGGSASFGRRQHELGPDYWRASADGAAVSTCPNGCSGRGRGGRCSYGFCHCDLGFWGIDPWLQHPPLLRAWKSSFQATPFRVSSKKSSLFGALCGSFFHREILGTSPKDKLLEEKTFRGENFSEPTVPLLL